MGSSPARGYSLVDRLNFLRSRERSESLSPCALGRGVIEWAPSSLNVLSTRRKQREATLTAPQDNTRIGDHKSIVQGHTPAGSPGSVEGRAASASFDYKAAGVDVAEGDRLVDWLKDSAPIKAPHADKLISGIGGFAAVFRMQFPQMKKPCLVSSTDGVGTKIKLAADFQSYATVGQDLVAMCVNDLVCCGAEPLFFLDYYATGHLDIEVAKVFLEGVRRACHQSGCALIGGETAEMPGIYHGRDFDAAGFAVGIVDEDKLLGPMRVAAGDQVIGVSSSGFHSNGYSLLRRVFAPEIESGDQEWRDILMRPTHLYAPLVLELARAEMVSAVANITGGGTENIPRVLPKGTCLHLLNWAWPEPFGLVQDRTGLSRVEMLQTLNCGLGLALVVKKAHVDQVCAAITRHGYQAFPLGVVEEAASPEQDAEVIY